MYGKHTDISDDRIDISRERDKASSGERETPEVVDTTKNNLNLSPIVTREKKSIWTKLLSIFKGSKDITDKSEISKNANQEDIKASEINQSESLSAQLEELKVKNKSAEIDFNKTVEVVKKLESELKELQDKSTLVENELEKINKESQAENNESSEKNTENLTKSQKLKIDISNIDKQKESLIIKLGIQTDREELSSLIEDIEAKIKDAKAIRDKTEKEFKKINTRFIEIRNVKIAKQIIHSNKLFDEKTETQVMENQKKKLKVIESQIYFITDFIDSVKHNHEISAERYNNVGEIMGKHIKNSLPTNENDLMKLIKILEQQKKSIQSDIENKEKYLSKISDAQIVLAKEKYSKITVEIEDQKEGLKRFETQLQAAKKEKEAQLKKPKQELKDAKENKKNLIENIEQELKGLKTKLRSSRVRFDGETNKLNTLEHQIFDLTIKLNIAIYKGQLAEVKDLQTTLSDLETRKEVVTLERDKFIEDGKELNTEIHSSRIKAEALKKENGVTIEEFKKKVSQVESVEDKKINTVQEIINNQRKIISDLKIKADKILSGLKAKYGKDAINNKIVLADEQDTLILTELAPTQSDQTTDKVVEESGERATQILESLID